jgi:hypothetical protein
MGKFSVDWKIEADIFSLTAKIPPGATAEFALPAGDILDQPAQASGPLTPRQRHAPFRNQTRADSRPLRAHRDPQRERLHGPGRRARGDRELAVASARQQHCYDAQRRAVVFAAIPDAVAAMLRLLIYGLLLVVMMHLRPQGLAGEFRVR